MGPIEFFTQPLWQRWAFSLMHFLWQGAAIAFLLVVLLKILNIRKASTRYSILLCGMLLMAVCPVVTFSVIDIPQAGIDESIGTDFDGLSNSEMNPLFDPFLEEEFLTSNTDGPDSEAATAMLAPKPIRQPSWIQKVQPYLLSGWMVGVFVMSLRLLMSVFGMQGMKRDRHAVSAELLSRVRSLAASLGFRSVPRIYVTRRIQEAVVIGFFRPMILLPAAWLMELSPDVLEAVIAHELSHIRRRDLWVNLFQRFVETLFFYHPAIWWVSRQIRLEREKCCDELAVSVTGERVVYATTLEFLARKRLAVVQPAMAVGMGGSKMALLHRVQNILGIVPNHERSSLWPVGVFTLMLVVFVGFGSFSLNRSENQVRAENEQILPKQIETQLPAHTEHSTESTRDAPTSLALANVVQTTADEQQAVEIFEKLDATIRRNDVGEVTVLFFNNNAKVLNSDLKHLKAFKKLEGLNFASTQINEVGLEHLKGLTSLKWLYLANTAVNDEGLAHLSKLPNLESLFLDATKITSDGLKYLQNMKSLKILHVVDTEIDDSGLAYLKDLPNLYWLNLTDTKITDSGFVHLKSLKNSLRRLDISGTQVTNDGLKHLVNITTLKILYLTDSKIGDAGLKHVKKILSLELLALKNSQVTDAGLIHIIGLNNLKILGLPGTKVTDAGMKQVAKMDSLQLLRLSDTAVSDAGLDHLKVMKNLKTLDLHNTQVTQAGVEKLKKALPNCKINYDGTTVTSDNSTDSTNPTEQKTTTVAVSTTADDEQAKQALKDLGASFYERDNGRTLAVTLQKNSQITDADLEPLKEPLKMLSVPFMLSFGETSVTGSGLKHFVGMNVRGLWLDSTKVTDKELAILNKFPKLTHLNLGHTKIDGSCFKNFEDFENLAFLYLSGTDVNDAALEEIKKLTADGLGIYLSDTKVTDKGLKHLEGLTNNLRYLSLPRQITDDGFQHLSALFNLTMLDLRDTKITDASLQHVANMTQLKWLLLERTQVTDKGLEHLNNLVQLRTLNLNGTKVTQAGVEKLKKALPKCKIEFP